MSAIEELGLSKEQFDLLYDQHGGFNQWFNKNHPTYESNGTVYSVLKNGADKLVEENRDVVDAITKVGFGDGNH